jgi:hypothetical protein
VSRRRVAVVLVAVAAIAVGLGVLANAERRPTITRHGSAPLPTGQPVLIDATPAAYRIDYRVEERVSGGVRVSTQRVTVRRPFESRVETFDGPPPGHGSAALDIVRLGRSTSGHPNAQPLVSDQPPALAAGDLRLDASLASAVHAGTAERRERRRVVARVCQVYRTMARLRTGAFARATRSQYVDSCVDREGLLLEEVQVVKGRRDMRAIAVRVDTTPRLSDATFATGAPTADVEHGGGATRRVDPVSSPPGPFWQLDTPPAGFGLVGRFVVVPPQPQNFSDPLRQGLQQAAVADVFVRGADAIIVERGGTLQGHDPWQSDPNNAAIDLGAVGRGEVLLTTRGAEVRALTGHGHYVRVLGSVPVDQLAAVARALHLVEGTQLKLLD